MLLDLKNNELIFSQISKPKEFKADLQLVKGLKHRDYKGKIYISMAYFKSVRGVLSKKYGRDLSVSMSYQKFANKFVLDKNPVNIEWSPATCTITGRDLPWEDIIPTTSYFDKRANNAKSYGKSWSGYTNLFDTINGIFPSGLLERIIKHLNKHGVPFMVNRTFDYPQPYLKLNPVFEFTPTEDQIDSVKALSDANYGIGKLPTGFGKTSYVAASLIATKGVKSLFLANQKVLTNDAKKDFDSVFKNDDIKIGVVGGGIFDPGDITIASIQTVAAALTPPTAKEIQLEQYQLELAEQRYDFFPDGEDKDKALKEVKLHRNRVESKRRQLERHRKIIPFLQSVDMFIVDEAQVLGTDQWNKFLHACPAPYRYTLSATPTRTDGGGIQIVAATGEQRFSRTASDQIKKGRLSEFKGHFVKFDHKIDKELAREIQMDYNQAYLTFIVNNEIRNHHLCRKVVEWARNSSVLALVTRKLHGEIIQNILLDMGMKEEDFRYLDGDSPDKYRDDSIEDFRNGKFPVLIGTSIFDVGFNAKNASKIVRFNAGGSEVREPQRAGRTVRLRADGSIGESYDILDVNVPFFESQGWKRRKFLAEEFGSQRVILHHETIEGELNVVGLREIVAAIPDKTDRAKGEEIIEALQAGQLKPEDIQVEEYKTEELEPNLRSLLDELTFME